MSETTALTIIPATSLPTIMQAEGAPDILRKLVEELSGFDSDVTTPAGRAEIASKARKAASAKMDLIRLGKSLTEVWRKSAAAVNAECKVVEQRMDELRDSIRKPLNEFEAIEAARVAGHQAAIAEIVTWADIPADWTSQQIAERIADLMQHPHKDRDWLEFKEKAQAAARASFNAMKVARVEAAEREEAAAVAAKEAAETAERQRQAEEAARNEREAYIAKEAADRAIKAAEEAASHKRESDVANKQNVNRIAADALVSAGLSTLDAVAVVTAIAKGRIPAISIRY
jgi:hypothetical protein